MRALACGPRHARSQPGPDAEERRPQWAWNVAVHAAAVIVLIVVGTTLRRRALPSDGLWYDDAWVATGAAKGGFGDLLTVATNHPGFTALMMVWARVVSPRTELMAVPAFVAGVLTAPLVYLVLAVRMRFKLAIGFVVAALVAVAPADIQYAGRVKSYVFETIVVFVLAAAIPRLARVRWTWSIVALWTVGATALGMLSVLTMMALAVATGIIALHPRGDAVRRVVALVVLGLVQGVYFRLVQRSFASSQVARDWGTNYDGYIRLYRDPVHLIRELGVRLDRVGQSLIVGGRVVTIPIVLAALAGLVYEATRGRRPIAARYLLALLAASVAGSVARVQPFGADNSIYLSPGWRATLWMLPVLLFGLAFALDAVFRGVGRHVGRSRPAVTRVLLAVPVIALAVVVLARGRDQYLTYPLSGSRSAHQVIASLDRRTPVLMFPPGLFPYAAEPGVPIRVVEARDTANGFRPVITDPRIHIIDAGKGSVEAIRLAVGEARQVVVHSGLIGFGDAMRPQVEASLRTLGFRQVRYEPLGNSVGIWIWARPPT